MGNTKSALAPAHAYGSETAIFLIGTPPTEFRIYKTLLPNRASTFKSYHTSAFTKNAPAILPNLDPTAFKDIVEYLHYGVVPQGNSTEWRMPNLKPVYGIRIIAIYSYAETWQMNELMNRILDEWRFHLSRTGAGVSPGQIKRIYEVTSQGSMLRRFAAVSAAWDCLARTEENKLCPVTSKYSDLIREIDAFKEDLASAQEEFGEVILGCGADPRGVGVRSKGKKARDFHVCAFHVHGDGEVCHADRKWEKIVRRMRPN